MSEVYASEVVNSEGSVTRSVYLDNNATTQVSPVVRAAMVGLLEQGWGNPSSDHSVGAKARDLVEKARMDIAKLFQAEASDVLFTSCGTESNNMVLELAQLQERPVITTASEHSSVKNWVQDFGERGGEVAYAPVNQEGVVEVGALAELLQKYPRALVSIHWANSETGVLQPIQEITKVAHEHDALVHSDAAQAVGKTPLCLETTQVDFLTFTGHKVHAPQGVAGVVGRVKGLQSFLRGGAQEKGRRPGTENVLGIVALAAALQDRFDGFDEKLVRQATLRDRFEQSVLKIDERWSINGGSALRNCNTTNLCFRPAEGGMLVGQLDQVGVQCSQSSACTNHLPEPSHVLLAMGLSKADAFASIRFALSQDTTEEDVDYAAESIGRIWGNLKEIY